MTAWLRSTWAKLFGGDPSERWSWRRVLVCSAVLVYCGVSHWHGRWTEERVVAELAGATAIVYIGGDMLERLGNLAVRLVAAWRGGGDAR